MIYTMAPELLHLIW